MLLNAYKGIVVAVNKRKSKYMEVECHGDMMANENIMIASN